MLSKSESSAADGTSAYRVALRFGLAEAAELLQQVRVAEQIQY